MNERKKELKPEGTDYSRQDRVRAFYIDVAEAEGRSPLMHVTTYDDVVKGSRHSNGPRLSRRLQEF